MSIEDRLRELGEELPPVARPLASYVPAVRTGNLVYCSGQLPTRGGELVAHGKVGVDVPVDDAVAAARVACLNALAAVASVSGGLDAIRQVIRVNGFVSSAPGFTSQPEVLNGASDFLLELFGDRGQHTRVAVGVAELPRNAPVEIDLIVEIES